MSVSHTKRTSFMIAISRAKYSTSSSARSQRPSSMATSAHVCVLVPSVSRPSWRSGRPRRSLWRMGLAGQPCGRMSGMLIEALQRRVG